jgi:cytochrome c peroxidase
VAETYPYFHDGSVENLGEATKIIAKLNLNVDLKEEQIKDLTTFMKALTADIPEEAKQVPPELANSI